jgi:hypothetical protein
MGNKSLKQMKKVLLGIFAIAIIGLTAANVNLTLNDKGYFVDMSLADSEALAQNENGGVCNKFHTQTDFYTWGEDGLYWGGAQMHYACYGGGDSSSYCTRGYENHYYNSDGSWWGFYGYTDFVSCNFVEDFF